MEQWMVVYPDSIRVFTRYVPMNPFAPVTHTAAFLSVIMAAVEVGVLLAPAAAAAVGEIDILVGK